MPTIKAELAAQYGSTRLITLDIPAGVCRRSRARALVAITFTVEIATSGTGTDGVPISVDTADLVAAIETVDDGALGSALGTALGATVTVASTNVTQATVTKTIALDCPKGKWCTAGLIVPCPVDTYNNLTGQDFATACKLCPANSHTEAEASTSADDCVCDVGFYDSVVGPGVLCEVCPTGTDCRGGATLERLPLKRAFYRTSNATVDVRRCPDAASNCSTNFGKPECVSTSGCLGGESVEDQCKQLHQADWHVLHEVCVRRRLASLRSTMSLQRATGARASCKECGGTLGTTMGIWRALGCLRWHWCPLLALRRNTPRARLCQCDVLAKLNKIKILFTFYMISTQSRHHLLCFAAAGRQEDPREPLVARRPRSRAASRPHRSSASAWRATCRASSSGSSYPL